MPTDRFDPARLREDAERARYAATRCRQNMPVNFDDESQHYDRLAAAAEECARR